MHLQNILPEPNFEMVYSRRFLVYKVQVYTRFMVLLPEINNSLLGNGVKNWCVCHVVSLNKFYGIGARD